MLLNHEKKNLLASFAESCFHKFMKIKELRKKTSKELEKILVELEEKLGKFRFDKDKEIKNHREIRMTRKQIARIKTLIIEKNEQKN